MTGTVLTASMVGYSFARLKWRGRDFWFIVLLATMMLPAQVLLIPHFLQYKWLGWINTYKPLIVPGWLGGGAFFVFLFRQFFKGVPKELEEAAMLDGASPWQIYTQIMLPLAKPALATVAVLSFIAHWQEFMGPLIYLSDFEKYPRLPGPADVPVRRGLLGQPPHGCQPGDPPAPGDPVLCGPAVLRQRLAANRVERLSCLAKDLLLTGWKGRSLPLPFQPLSDNP